MEKETHKASPELKKFFEKLLDLKHYVSICQDGEEIHIDYPGTIKEINERLDDIIKEKK